MSLFSLFQWIIILVLFAVLFKVVDPKHAKKHLTTLKYICVYLLAFIFIKMLCIILAFAFLEVDAYDWFGFIIVRCIIFTLIKIYGFIFIYNIFNDLSVKKVYLYLFGLGYLELLIPISIEYITAAIVVELGGAVRWAEAIYLRNIYHPSNFINAYLELFSLMVIVVAIEEYYKKRPERWY